MIIFLQFTCFSPGNLSSCLRFIRTGDISRLVSIVDLAAYVHAWSGGNQNPHRALGGSWLWVLSWQVLSIISSQTHCGLLRPSKLVLQNLPQQWCWEIPAAFSQHYSVCFTLDNSLAPRNVWGKTILSQCQLVLGVEEQAGSWRCPGTLRTLPQVLSFYVCRDWISTVKSVLLSQRHHEHIW